jgi:hypothetical protein
MIITSIIAKNDRNNPMGYTEPNLFNSVCVVRGFIAIQDVVAFPIKLSPNTKNIPSGIIDKTVEKNIISIQILLFSYLFMLEKNIISEITNPITNQVKWKWYQYGLNNIFTSSKLFGINQ